MIETAIETIETIVSESHDDDFFNCATRFKHMARQLFDTLEIEHPDLHGSSLGDAWDNYINIHNNMYHNGIATGALRLATLIDEVIEMRGNVTTYEYKRYLFDIYIGLQGMGFVIYDKTDSEVPLPTFAISDFNRLVLR